MVSKIQLEDLGGGKYKLTIWGEDHSIGNILSKTLLSMEEVSFSYYEQPHPLEEYIIVFIHLRDEKTSIKDVLMKALDRILEVNNEFRELYLKALREKGLSIES
ncbi:MAG: RpoL/Rpb11 RNA polymerase subunit family protein [Acidilobaceae archaeon]